ncbi:MAG: hypothetical protein HRU20_18090 [Pseudomonadales bacterium]|nr:hypothetical protein [Pseudomonadales bacterium]
MTTNTIIDKNASKTETTIFEMALSGTETGGYPVTLTGGGFTITIKAGSGGDNNEIEVDFEGDAAKVKSAAENLVFEIASPSLDNGWLFLNPAFANNGSSQSDAVILTEPNRECASITVKNITQPSTWNFCFILQNSKTQQTYIIDPRIGGRRGS